MREKEGGGGRFIGRCHLGLLTWLALLLQHLLGVDGFPHLNGRQQEVAVAGVEAVGKGPKRRMGPSFSSMREGTGGKEA